MRRHLTIILPLLIVIAACDMFYAENEYLDEQPEKNNFVTVSGGMKTMMSDGEERSYFLKLPDGFDGSQSYPLIIALHGTGGNSSRYLQNEYYNLQGAVGNGAILVYPNALPNISEIPQWNFLNDLTFFDDLIADLQSTIPFDRNRLFVVGHSSGAGFAHQLGCQRGNVIRAIAPVAGGLVDDSNCTGEVAVIQIQGSKDTMVPPSAAEPGRDYWVTYNGCDSNRTKDVFPSPCAAYADCDPYFPVQYCEHEEEDPERHGGHAWPSFGGEAIWSFFKKLPGLPPSSRRGSGAEAATLAGISAATAFTLRFPADFSPPPISIGLSLYQAGTRQPIDDAPLYLLSTKEIPIGSYEIGGETEYFIEETNLTTVEVPGDYTFAVVVYVEGSSWPIPTWGRDYVGIIDISLNNHGPIVINTPIDLEILEGSE